MVCLTVLTYVFGGGMRSLSFANALHATVLILLGGVILFLVLDKLGGAAAASALVAAHRPELLVRGGRQDMPSASGSSSPTCSCRCRSACSRTFSSTG